MKFLSVRLGAVAACLFAVTISTFANGLTVHFNPCTDYSAAEGGSFSGTIQLLCFTKSFDSSCENHFSNPQNVSLCINGTGTHPIVVADLNPTSDFGTCGHIVTVPANTWSQGFTINFNGNSTVDYDRTGTISFSGWQTTNCQSRAITLYDMNSVMSVAIVTNTTYYSTFIAERGVGVQTVTMRIYRGDTLNARTVGYTVSGNAASGSDYTASPSLSGSVTIAAGSDHADTTISIVNNTNLLGTKFLTVTLDSGYYQISTNNSATLAIAQDVPVVSLSPDFSYAVQGYSTGTLSIARSGGLSNSLRVNLSIGGTATPGTHYPALPTSVVFATNQTVTNLSVAINASPILTEGKTVVATVQSNSAYFLGADSQAVLTLYPFDYATNYVPNPVGRYWRGSGTDPTYWSIVVPLDYENGVVYSNVDGNCSTLYPGLANWNGQLYYHYDATNTLPQTNVANRIPFNNPIVAFGERVGGTPLYLNQDYRFGIYAGDSSSLTTQIVVRAFYRTNFAAAGTISIKPPNVANASEWGSFVTNGFQLVTNAFGLTTTLSASPSLRWGTFSYGEYVLNHSASEQATNYYYVVQQAGIPGGSAQALAVSAGGVVVPSLLYSLEFGPRPPWRSVFLDQPHFDGKPLPPFYSGKTLDEILTNTPVVTNAIGLAPSVCTNLDNSPELRRHPILDQFVADLGNDPMALANFVLNEIDLTDAMEYNDNGSIAEHSINLGGISRGALGTFLERQGSPTEQCALLVYLLRQAGVPAAFVFPPHNGMQILDARLSRMLKFQVHGSFSEAGELYTTNAMIPVNYPWVAAYIGTNWVHLFPWLKDYRQVEGLELYSLMPANYSSAYPWVRDYVFGNTNLLALAVDGDNTPRVIFPRFLAQTLQQNHPGISVDDIGVQIVNRRRNYSRWQDFPTPTYLTNSSIAVSNLTDANIVNISPALANLFDTVSVEIYSVVDPTKDIQTGDMRLADLHNRQFYLTQTATNSTQVQLSLILSAYRTNILMQASFGSSDTNLLSKQVKSMTLDQLDDDLRVRLKYNRHRALTPAFAADGTISFLGFGSSRQMVVERSLRKGDIASICMDYGRVTRQMLDVHAVELWQMEKTLRTNAGLAGSISSDLYQGKASYLAGMSYYKKTDDFDALNKRLHKITPISTWAAGLSIIGAARNSSGTLSNNAVDPVLPMVDMFSYETASVGNDTARPDSGRSEQMEYQNYALLSIADGSAQEHQVINSYYQQTNAVSTVRLLQLAQSRGLGIVTLTVSNYLAQGNTTYQGKALKDHDPGLWQDIVSAFQNAYTTGYVTAYVTPGPVTNAAYKGMAALVLGWGEWSALISPGSLNGGFGEKLSPGSVAAANTPNYDLSKGEDLSLSLHQPANDTTLAPPQVASFDYAQTSTEIQNGVYAYDSVATNWSRSANTMMNQSTAGSFDTTYNTAFQTTEQQGLVDTRTIDPSQNEARVLDPVHTVTGEFYADELDLALPGPLPLALRRNYSSHNLAQNQFGYGWKPTLMSYLSVGKNLTNIYAADMDGAVLCYTRLTPTTNLWLPKLSANPHLNNNTTAGAGGLVNRLRDRLVQSVNGTTTNYTLYGADGSVRLFTVTTNNNGILKRVRPYLQQWTDNRGNFYSFTYGTNVAGTDFGEVKRIQCSNGNFLGLRYDIYGNIIEAYTGDGRKVEYEYDEFGDLITVTLPDASTRTYVYQHLLQSPTQKYYSTHLIVEENKPDGRSLINEYDQHRRVTNQLSTAGLDLIPVRTGTFIYSNNFNFTNTFTNTISGYTLVIDGLGNTNRYDYTNSLITKITDPLNQTLQQVWYADTATAPGYPRSIQQRTDQRGLVTQYFYDSNGNVTNTITTGDLTGDNNFSQTATNTATYNTNGLPTQMTDPIGNSNVIVYHTNYPFLPQRTVRYAGGVPVGTNWFEYANVTNVVTLGASTQTNRAFGVMTRQITAFSSPDAATNDFAWDEHGWKTQEIGYTGTGDPAITNSFLYNLRGELVLKTDAANRSQFFAYDGMGRKTIAEVYDAGQTVPLDFAYSYYNDNGELVWMDGPRFDPEDYVWRDYDGAGRLATEIHWRSQAQSDGTGVEAPSGYDLYAQTFREYDVYGNLTRSIDPRGAITTNTWDKLGRLAQTRSLDLDGVTVLRTEGFAYEPGGQPAFLTNALGGVTEKQYTSGGQLKFQKDPDGSTNAWRYYADGRVRHEIQNNGAYWETTYDDANRKVTLVFHSAADSPLATNRYEFDRRGNLVKHTDAAGFAFTNLFDGLDRLKISAGPPIVTVNEDCGFLPGCGNWVTNVSQQLVTRFYAAAGVWQTNVNALGEKTIARFDALGRPTRTEIRTSGNVLVRESSTAYSADHHSVTVTNGSGASAIVSTIYTDNNGQQLLAVAYPHANVREFTRTEFDPAGNPFFSGRYARTNTGAPYFFSGALSQYDGLNRLKQQWDRDDALTTFAYNAAGNVTNRTMPGGLQWNAIYNNAGQMLQDWNTGAGGAGTRTNRYAYYPAGNAFAGLLQTTTNAVGVRCDYTYDHYLRTATATHQSPLVTNLTYWTYDARGLVTQLAEVTPTDTATVNRTHDAYGQLVSDLTQNSSAYGFSHASQTWDAAGRRTRLTLFTAAFTMQDYAFGWRPDGTLAAVTSRFGAASYAYNSAGLLTNRTAASRFTTINSLDGAGRPLAITTKVGLATTLTEGLTYTGDGLLSAHTVGRGDFTNAASYAYAALTRRLAEERLNLDATKRWTNSFAFDGGAESGPGALTKVGPVSGSAQWSGAVDAFSRINVATNTYSIRSAQGRANGPSTIFATLDDQSVPVAIAETFSGSWPISWRASLQLNAGAHQLSVTAAHPSGQFTTNRNVWFTNNVAHEAVSETFDAAGRLTYRVWKKPDGTTNRTETLIWDLKGRLAEVNGSDAQGNGYGWSAAYDPLSRKLYTEGWLTTNGIYVEGSINRISSHYDPLVEFLEVGVVVNGRTTWKLQGPDLNGIYGGMNGVGGLEGTQSAQDAFQPAISDARGNVLGAVTNGINVSWNPSRPTGYGAVPGYRLLPLTMGASLITSGQGGNVVQSSAWRGKYPETTGYIYLGARFYDPVAAQWLSSDPVWNGRDPNYYTFAGGDPINYFDSDGRLGKGTLERDLHDLYAEYVSSQAAYLYYVNGQASIGFPQAKDFDQFIQDALYVGQDSVLNTSARNEAKYEMAHRDLSTGWGRATYVGAVVSYGANTVDAGVNMIPVIGGVKGLVETGVKAGIKQIGKVFVKEAAEESLKVGTKEFTRLTAGETVQVGRHTVGRYGDVAGHHPHQQAARNNNPLYDPDDALAVQPGTYDHAAISRAQTTLNAEARASGRAYDLAAEESIQREAMRRGGFTEPEIDAILQRSRAQLPAGAQQPTRIPGSRRGN
ncbi:hypothetical protein GC207_03030 [bacterium]|nr:hypothetical protein [bacterium]